MTLSITFCREVEYNETKYAPPISFNSTTQSNIVNNNSGINGRLVILAVFFISNNFVKSSKIAW